MDAGQLELYGVNLQYGNTQGGPTAAIHGNPTIKGFWYENGILKTAGLNNPSTGILFGLAASRPSFSQIGNVTNSIFMWQSNSVPPVIREEYYDTHTNIVVKSTR